MIVSTENGLYCPAGNFYIDPWRAVDTAIITHAHSDHARFGSNKYFCVKQSEGILRYRLGEDFSADTLEYGEVIKLGDVQVSLHPAGHILGSAQVRVERAGQVWVASGDYKREADPTCAPFEPIKCDTFITESTFGLPIYTWQSDSEVFEEVNKWWRKNAEEGKSSLILGYSLGKAQRLLKGIDSSIGPIYTHGAIEALNEIYRASGISLPETQRVPLIKATKSYAGALIVAPPAVLGSAWVKRFGTVSTAFASGWMRIRGMRRRYAVDRGFVLSDHADWPSLLRTIRETGAQKVLVTHGYSDVLVRYLREIGIDSDVMETQYQGESEESVLESQIQADSETAAGEIEAAPLNDKQSKDTQSGEDISTDQSDSSSEPIDASRTDQDENNDEFSDPLFKEDQQ
ncbi:MAG: ligase-associated DNA damage response exonuclease [Candidatus Melainabacteria bacterium]|nr:ligase-associated DNA damage response exonuclease [Candidatus Melainabacteria bacterium]